MIKKETNDWAVEIDGLVKTFGNFTAVDHVSLKIKKGEIFGFLGPNGAGKSTTIRMLCGILAPTSGQGRVGGFDIYKESEKIKQNIGYMSQKFSLYEDLTVEENIDFYSGIYCLPREIKAERKEWALRMAGLQERRTSPAHTLAGGWKQRLALGCSLIHKPKIIFLDEPTSGVDPITRNNFWDIIKDLAKQGVTVFVTTHYMGEAENCDRMTLIYKGTIIAMGTSEEMKTKFMKNDVIQIIAPDAEGWIDKILSLKGIKEAALFGNAVHAITPDAGSATPLIKGMLDKEGCSDYKINKIKATLEDVFVSLIEDHDKEYATEPS